MLITVEVLCVWQETRASADKYTSNMYTKQQCVNTVVCVSCWLSTHRNVEGKSRKPKNGLPYVFVYIISEAP